MRKFKYIFIGTLSLLAITQSSINAQDDHNTYRIKVGDTYYSISRALQIKPQELIKANNAKPLLAGDTIVIPKHQSIDAQGSSSEFITHTIQNKETLFKIAKNYHTTVNQIKIDNNIVDDNIKVGQTIKIRRNIASSISHTKHSGPDKNSTQQLEQQSVHPPEPTEHKKTNTISYTSSNTASDKPEAENIKTETKNFTTVTPIDNDSISINKNSLTSIQHTTTVQNTVKKSNHSVMQQQGVGTWLNDSDLNFSKSVALHNQAPIGTIIKVSNPMNRRSIYTKVIGKFNENDNNKDAIIVISQSAATLLGVLDKRFRVSLEYAGN